MNFKEEYGVDLESNQVISCKTQEQAERVVSLLENRGCKFPVSKSYTVGAFGLFEDSLCYELVEKEGSLLVHHRDRSNFSRKDSVFVKADKFLLKNENHNPLFKEGDFVVRKGAKSKVMTITEVVVVNNEVLYRTTSYMGETDMQVSHLISEVELQKYLKPLESKFSAEEKLNTERLLREIREWERDLYMNYSGQGEEPKSFDELASSILRRYRIVKR